MAKSGKRKPTAAVEDCFLIMPISDQPGYQEGHFLRVYKDIFQPACAMAGFRAVRADEIRQTNVIHLDILKRLIEAPMALCDLSSRNPNVLFELGIRQAFDKPVVIVQEEGTERIFDVSILRAQDYRRTLLYHTVLEDQIAIAEVMKATKAAKPDSVNSIVRLLSLSAARLDESAAGDATGMFNALMNQLSELGAEMQRLGLNGANGPVHEINATSDPSSRPESPTSSKTRVYERLLEAHKAWSIAVASQPDLTSKDTVVEEHFRALFRMKGHTFRLKSNQRMVVQEMQRRFLERYPVFTKYFID